MRWLLQLLIAASIAGCSRAPADDLTHFRHDGAVILVTIDTLRADRVGLYGSTRGLTPRIDALAQPAGKAVVFRHAIAQAPLTLPSHATILTGLYPAGHGIRTNDGFRLGPGIQTLADAFKAAGYATGAFVGGYPLNADTGLTRGFDRYDDEFLKSGANERQAADVVASATRWIRGHANGNHRFFAWIHLFDPHTPYDAPQEFAAAHPGAPYDAEVAYTDAALGRFLDDLRASGIFDGALVVVVADHGESLGEHGERTHGTFLYDATIRVPLIIRLPGSRHTPAATVSVSAPVETADLTPTIAAMTGLPWKTRTDGVDIRPLMRVQTAAAPATAAQRRDAVYSETYYQHVLLGWSPLRALRGPEWKLIEAPRSELYDLQRDPGETTNVIADHPSVARAMAARLPASTPSAAPAEPASESAERLRTLGYVAGRTDAPVTRGLDPKDGIGVWNAIEEGIDAIERNPVTAAAAFRQALKLDPSNGLAMKYLADLFFRAGRWREAAAGYRRAIAAGFEHQDTHINLAAIAERDGKTDEARRALGKAVKVAPHDADAWNRLGLLEFASGSVDAARRAFTEAIAAAPTRAEPYYNLALVERRKGDDAAAEMHLRAALERNPRYAEARYELATALLAAKHYTRALEDYRAALAVRPDYPEAMFGAARAELELGLRDEARQHYEAFIRAAPPAYERQVAAAREAIRRLGQNR